MTGANAVQKPAGRMQWKAPLDEVLVKAWAENGFPKNISDNSVKEAWVNIRNAVQAEYNSQVDVLQCKNRYAKIVKEAKADQDCNSYKLLNKYPAPQTVEVAHVKKIGTDDAETSAAAALLQGIGEDTTTIEGEKVPTQEVHLTDHILKELVDWRREATVQHSDSLKLTAKYHSELIDALKAIAAAIDSSKK